MAIRLAFQAAKPAIDRIIVRHRCPVPVRYRYCIGLEGVPSHSRKLGRTFQRLRLDRHQRLQGSGAERFPPILYGKNLYLGSGQ